MSPKKKKKLSSQLALSYDLGGTKVAVGIVDHKGKILEQIRVPVLLEKGQKAVLDQLAELGILLMKNYKQVKVVGLASAGPLDPRAGVLLDPTNFKTDSKAWGKVPIVKMLKSRLKKPVYLDNDAAAAVLAECWLGTAKNAKNVLFLTLGTGLGTGIVVNGALVRAGRDLHTEGGHLIIQYNDKSARCGCGDYGCAEAYLSGFNFARRFQEKYLESSLTAKDILDLARKNDPRAIEAFDEYGKIMAIVIRNFVVLYAPEVVVFGGSFASAFEFFADKTRYELGRLLQRRRVGVDLFPKLSVSALGNNAGLVGGAKIAFLQNI